MAAPPTSPHPTGQAVKHRLWNYWVFYISPCSFTSLPWAETVGPWWWGVTAWVQGAAALVLPGQPELQLWERYGSARCASMLGTCYCPSLKDSDSSQKNPHIKRWIPRRAFPGSAPAGPRLAWCFWRALCRELTTSVPWTPRTLKCFVHSRRTPWKETVQWPKSTQTTKPVKTEVCGEVHY